MRLRTLTYLTALTTLSACGAAGVVENGTSGRSSGTTIGLGSGTSGGSQSASSSGATSGTGSGTRSTSGGSGSTTSSSTSGLVCGGGAQTCNGVCCPTGWGCVSNVCCQSPCNGTCCNSTQTCATLTGVTQCAQKCAESSRCPPTAPCCLPVDAGLDVCVNEDPSNGVCICARQSDCDAGGDTACCAPATNLAGDPVGPYVCKPNDGNHYDCCVGTFTTCGGSDCCIKDAIGNEFCAAPCDAGAECGAAAQCQAYDFTITATTCSGPNACGPI